MSTLSNCPVCGKLRAHANHKECSRQLQRLYAPGTVLRQEQEKDRQMRKDSRLIRPFRRENSKGVRNVLFSRLRKGE